MIPLHLSIIEYSINNVLLLVYYDSVEKIMVQGIKVPAVQRRVEGHKKRRLQHVARAVFWLSYSHFKERRLKGDVN